MISAFYSQGGLIVAAPSNAAVASLAIRAWETGLFELNDIIVYGDNADASVRFLNPVQRGEYRSELFKDFFHMSKKRKEETRHELLKWLHLDSHLSVAELNQLCPYIDRATKEGRDFYADLIASARVIFCTLNSAGASVLRRCANVETMLLDEAGQCTEAEFYIGATFPGVQRVCVIGDPKQLPATVIHPSCRLAGFGKSWLEKIHSTYPHKVHLLDTQYRM